MSAGVVHEFIARPVRCGEGSGVRKVRLGVEGLGEKILKFDGDE